MRALHVRHKPRQVVVLIPRTSTMTSPLNRRRANRWAPTNLPWRSCDAQPRRAISEQSACSTRPWRLSPHVKTHGHNGRRWIHKTFVSGHGVRRRLSFSLEQKSLTAPHDQCGCSGLLWMPHAASRGILSPLGALDLTTHFEVGWGAVLGGTHCWLLGGGAGDARFAIVVG